MRAPSRSDHLAHLRTTIISAFMSGDHETWIKAVQEAELLVRGYCGEVPRGRYANFKGKRRIENDQA